jgi:hypothetical protein
MKIQSLELDLDHKSLSSRSTGLIVDLLRENKAVEKLSLFSNYISDDGVDILYHTLLDHPSIKTIVLSYNAIGNRGAGILARLVEQKRLYSLDLDENEIERDGVALIIESVNRNRYITTVSLHGNPGFQHEEQIQLELLLRRNKEYMYLQNTKAAEFLVTARMLMMIDCCWDLKCMILKQIGLDVTHSEFWMLTNSICNQEIWKEFDTTRRFSLRELLRQCRAIQTPIQSLSLIDVKSTWDWISALHVNSVSKLLASPIPSWDLNELVGLLCSQKWIYSMFSSVQESVWQRMTSRETIPDLKEFLTHSMSMSNPRLKIVGILETMNEILQSDPDTTGFHDDQIAEYVLKFYEDFGNV